MKSLRDARLGQWRMLMVSRLVRFVRGIGCGTRHAPVVDEAPFGMCIACDFAVERPGWDDLCFACQEDDDSGEFEEAAS